MSLSLHTERSVFLVVEHPHQSKSIYTTKPNQPLLTSNCRQRSRRGGAGGAWVERWMVVKAFLADGDGDGDGGGCAGRSTRAFVSSNHHLLLEYK